MNSSVMLSEILEMHTFCSLVYLAAALPAPSASPRFVQVPAGDDEVVTVDLEAEPDYKFLNDVARNPRNAYILFTRRNPHNGQTLILNDANSIRNSNFNPAHTTIAIAHGYIQSQNSNLNQIIRDAYLNRMEANVIVLDWSRISQMDYMTAIYAIPSVGQGLGNLLNFISTVTGAPLTNMHVTGFSLGSHVAGNAGRTIRGLARVTGLDPYSPVWNLNSNRLAASDAVYVEAIHTSGNTGNRLFADVDYFVNGGDNQPGCWTSICSHNRSWEVFAATVTFNHLHGNQCTNVAEMRNNQCRGSQLPLGNSDVNKRGSGIFRVNTVLPPTTLALTSTASSTTTFNISTSTYATAIPPIPPSDRDRFLTFAESGHHRTFMFAKDNTFIQLDGDIIQRFQLRLCREISFKFRTRLPHGLLVYHNVKNPVFKMQPYALYVIVEKGELKVVHVFGKHLTSVTVGRALNRDQWHSVQVTIDVHGARLIAKVDQMKEEVYLKGLSFDTNYGITDNLTSVILIGGYIGQNCHFATFRKTCEELALLGYTRNDVYLIDIDGNGKFPPAHVKGYCSCGINATCANPTQTCNCDANENKWHADEGTFVIPKSLGITEMFFLQQKDLTEEAQGRITLGPLECVETNIFVEVNEYTMKPLEEYMMFTRDSEKVVVVNAQGVRSAQCSADFDEAWPERDQLSPTHNGSFLISGDKTWVEDPPSRVPYDSLYQQPDAEEENTDKFFIALIVIYILGLCYCGYHMKEGEEANKEGTEKKSNGVTVDVIPMVIVEVPEDK
ncbi:hypothetical protein MSG28_005270, partial [Choristoneura fumiferana]